MSITDQLDISTLFKKRSTRIIICKNSYDRKLVYKFADENMLDAVKIEMKDQYGNTQVRRVLRCNSGCGGSLIWKECDCISESCDTIWGICTYCKYRHIITPSSYTVEPVYGIKLSKRA